MMWKCFKTASSAPRRLTINDSTINNCQSGFSVASLARSRLTHATAGPVAASDAAVSLSGRSNRKADGFRSWASITHDSPSSKALRALGFDATKIATANIPTMTRMGLGLGRDAGDSDIAPTYRTAPNANLNTSCEKARQNITLSAVQHVSTRQAGRG